MSEAVLSKREQEVVAELSRGGRVPVIAKHLSISPTTVRNHLQRIFWKLGVHSQAELVEHVRAHPEIIGLAAAETAAEESAAFEERYWEANLRLARDIDAMFGEAWRPGFAREIIHRALPLSEESRREWRARLALWSRDTSEDSDLAARRSAEMEAWRSQALQRVEAAQADGWVRSDLTATSILEQLFSLLVGVSMQIVAEPKRDRPDLVRVIDAYLEDLESGPRAGEWQA